MMQVVNRQKVLLILFILISSISFSQEIIPTNNNGGYTFEEETNKNESIKIFGKVYNLKKSTLIKAAEITFLCQKVISDEKGYYQFYIDNADYKYNYLKASAIGYKSVETNFFNIENSNIRIDFYLGEDDIPFINCE